LSEELQFLLRRPTAMVYSVYLGWDRSYRLLSLITNLDISFIVLLYVCWQAAIRQMSMLSFNRHTTTFTFTSRC